MAEDNLKPTECPQPLPILTKSAEDVDREIERGIREVRIGRLAIMAIVGLLIALFVINALDLLLRLT